MKRYELWDLRENRWFEGGDFHTDEEEKALAWRQQMVEEDYKFWDENGHTKYGGETFTNWYKRNYPHGHYTLYAFVVGENHAV